MLTVDKPIDLSSTRHCLYPACGAPLRLGRVLCETHWTAIPPPLQLQIRRAAQRIAARLLLRALDEDRARALRPPMRET